MTVKITIRSKLISKGRESLYLDFYPAIPHPITGKPTRREFINKQILLSKKEIKSKIKDLSEKIKNKDEVHSAYNTQYKQLLELKEYDKTFKGLSESEIKDNKESFEFAEKIKSKRQNILDKPEIYVEFEKEQLRIKELNNQNFVDYFKKLADKRKASNYDNWISALHYLEAFTGGSIKFADLNENILEEFKEYLLTTQSKRSDKTTLSINSAVSYFNKVKATLKQAYKEGIIQTDINAKISPIKPEETHREYLTLEELNKLAKTPFKNDLFKRAVLFSALTGLRFSDIQKMVWSELEHVKGQGYVINFHQKKTKSVEVYPISDQAFSFTKGAENPRDMMQDKKVFENLTYSAYNNRLLADWILEAGIHKKISFHNFRHTFSVLQLFNGTDIYTVSKMLGHRNLKTTQIYAKIVDEKKREASNKIQIEL